MTTPGRTARLHDPYTEARIGIAALIPYEALHSLLAAELTELRDRSENSHHEHYWGVYEKGEVFNAGDMHSMGGRMVQTPRLFGKGNLLFDVHTHPPITTFGGNAEQVTPVGTQTNNFSATDLSRCQALIEQYPNVICAVAAPNGLLVYLKDKSATGDPSQPAAEGK